MSIKASFVLIIMMDILLLSCVPNSEQTQSPTRIPAQLSTEVKATEPRGSIPTSIPSITNTSESAIWTIVENWIPANQIRTMLIDRSGDLWAGGPSGLVHWDLETGKPTIYALNGNTNKYTGVIGLAQTSDNAVWAGTFGNGITIFKNKRWESLTVENGLPGNYVTSLTATDLGEIWADMKKMPYSADSGQDHQFGRFDEKKWINEVGGGFSWVIASPTGSIFGAYNEPFTGYTFRSRVAEYSGQMWNELAYFPYEYIDAITVAPDGVIWIATSDNLFRVVSRTLHKIRPPWAGTDFPSVSSIAVAEDGTAWFGFSRASFLEYPCGSGWDREQGVYRYDGKTWTHFTSEDGLVDNKICAITLDSSGNIWFGSFDKGISHFDGKTWKTYVIP